MPTFGLGFILQWRRAIDNAVEKINLVGEFMENQVVPSRRLTAIFQDLIPGQYYRPAIMSLAKPSAVFIIDSVSCIVSRLSTITARIDKDRQDAVIIIVLH